MDSIEQDVRNLNKNVNKFVDKLHKNTTKAFFDILGDVVYDATRLTPVDTGFLVSNYVVSSQPSGKFEVNVALTNDTPYAIEQHEFTHYKHKYPTQHSFLRDPVEAHKHSILLQVRDKIKI